MAAKGGSADDGSASDETPALPHPDSSGYTQSDTITAAELTRRTQAASAANQQSISRTQNSTGSSAAQQLTASYTGSLTAVFNVDGRENGPHHRVLHGRGAGASGGDEP